MADWRSTKSLAEEALETMRACALEEEEAAQYLADFIDEVVAERLRHAEALAAAVEERVRRAPPNMTRALAAALLAYRRAQPAPASAAADQPKMDCPRCGREYDDFDGVGVVYCAPPEGCGYCRHLARSGTDAGWRCDFCGDVETR